MRVELGPLVPSDLVQRLADRGAVSVRPAHDDGLERVDHREDARAAGDPLTLKALRVAGAVELLARIQDDRHDRLEAVERLDDLRPLHRVLAQQRVFLARELRRFFQDLFGDADTGRVFQENRVMKRLSLLLAEAQLPGDLERDAQQRLGGRARDARAEDHGQRLDRAERDLLLLLVELGVLDRDDGLLGQRGQNLPVEIGEPLLALLVADRYDAHDGLVDQGDGDEFPSEPRGGGLGDPSFKPVADPDTVVRVRRLRITDKRLGDQRLGFFRRVDEIDRAAAGAQDLRGQVRQTRDELVQVQRRVHDAVHRVDRRERDGPGPDAGPQPVQLLFAGGRLQDRLELRDDETQDLGRGALPDLGQAEGA